MSQVLRNIWASSNWLDPGSIKGEGNPTLVIIIQMRFSPIKKKTPKHFQLLSTLFIENILWIQTVLTLIITVLLSHFQYLLGSALYNL